MVHPAIDTPTHDDESSSPRYSIDMDLPCRECGYNLRGLQTVGKCPECGSLISRSLADEHIASSSKKWLRLIRWGLWLLAASLILRLQQVVVWFLGYWGIMSWPGRDLYLHLQWIVFAIGAWLITTPEPGRAARQRKTRNATRLCMIVVAITGFVQMFLLVPVEAWQTSAYFRFKHLVLLTGIGLLLCHVGELTCRLGRTSLPRQLNFLLIAVSLLITMLLISTLIFIAGLFSQLFSSFVTASEVYQIDRIIFYPFYTLYSLLQLYLCAYFIMILLAIRRATNTRTA